MSSSIPTPPTPPAPPPGLPGDDSGDATDTTSESGTTTITAGDGKVTIVKHGGPDGQDGQAVTTVPDDNGDHFVGYDSHHGWSHGAPWWLVLIGMVLLARIVQTAIRAKHGDFRSERQRRSDERAGKPMTDLGVARENELLVAENTALKAQATRLEERVAVLERIVTDPAKRVSDEIDALR